MCQCAAQSSAPWVLTTIVCCSWWLAHGRWMVVWGRVRQLHRTAAAAASVPVQSYVLPLWTQLVALEGIRLAWW